MHNPFILPMMPSNQTSKMQIISRVMKIPELLISNLTSFSLLKSLEKNGVICLYSMITIKHQFHWVQIVHECLIFVDWCFFPTFLAFSGVSYLLISYINSSVESELLKMATIIVCLGQNVSYLIMALSNPGIAVHPKYKNEKVFERTHFCIKCKFDVPVRSIHCIQCDVCIIGYDHHCPWTSKCIGVKNTSQFYTFLIMTPLFFIYCAFVFGFTASDGAMRQKMERERNNLSHDRMKLL